MPDTHHGRARNGFRPSTKYQVPGTSERKTPRATAVRGRSLRFAGFMVALGLVLAGCGGVAATVNGVDITDDDIAGLTTDSEGAASADAEQYRNLVTNSIVTVSMVTAAEQDFGLEDLSSKESTDAYLARASEQDIALIGRVASNPALTANAVELVTVQLNVRDSVKAELVSEATYLEDVWQNDQNLLMLACASHVLVATEEEAKDARARFEAGEDFSALATELSLDTESPGGALPCPSRPDDFLQPFSSVVATAPVGEVAGPVETQFGWHIVLVDSREFPQNLDELSQDPLRWLPPALVDAAWTGWINESLESANIEVRSQIGTWYPPVDGIIPPPPSP